MICNSLPVATDGDRTKRTNMSTNHALAPALYTATGKPTRGTLLPLSKEIAATGYTPAIAIIGEFANWDMAQLGNEFVTPATHRVVLARVPQPDGKAARASLVLTKDEVEKALSPATAVEASVAPSAVAPAAPLGDNSAAILAGVIAGTVLANPDGDGRNYWCAKTGALLAYDVTRNLYVGNSKDAWGGDPTMVGSTKKMVLTKDGENFA